MDLPLKLQCLFLALGGGNGGGGEEKIPRGEGKGSAGAREEGGDKETSKGRKDGGRGADKKLNQEGESASTLQGTRDHLKGRRLFGGEQFILAAFGRGGGGIRAGCKGPGPLVGLRDPVGRDVALSRTEPGGNS